MSKLTSLKPLAAGVGAAFVASALSAAPVNASENPFATNDLSSGYTQLAKGHKEGKCGEGKCGEGHDGKDREGKCGEGKCGEGKADKEGKCGEGKCGEGKCGEGKADKEGKCGEGKCGS
ncbi:MAG: hypothetical protein R3208_03030 [Ketobacteraceae bacterium]|nr:hypothetical protein [Ketobacteraceae bacterium]